MPDLKRLTPMQVMTITQRVASTYPSNTEEYMALAIAAGIVGGLHMSGGLNDVVMQDGTFPVPGTLADAMQHGPNSIDPTLFEDEDDGQ